jgi:hypothetical protein
VESANDARLFSSCYLRLKPRIGSERSLEFVATGTKGPKGTDINTGCTNVIRIVNDLVAAGNTSVSGLLDWDGKHDPFGRIHVLAHRKRNGIENILLDPLLLSAFFVREFKDLAKVIGLQNISWHSFMNDDHVLWQQAAAALVRHIMDDDPIDLQDCMYLGGFELSIDSRYLHMDDHKIADIIIEKFPGLRTIIKSGSNLTPLMLRIVETVIDDKIDFAPVELLEIMKSLLEPSAGD